MMRTLKALRRNWAILLLVGFLVACAVLPPYVMPHDPNEVGVAMPLADPSAEFLLGADPLGRDMASRLIAAARIAVLAAVESIAIALSVGAVLGLAAAYAGGRTDFLIMRLADFLFSFPGFLVAIILIAALGPGLEQAALAIGIVYTPRFIKVTRVEARREMGAAYVDAARLARRSGLFIMARHVLPNVSSPLVALTALSMATAQLTYAALAFLGFGARAPQADYGEMLSKARAHMLEAPLLVLAPAVALAVLVLAFTLLGDLVRDRLDPRGGRHGV
jgi:ABC-type dipeptide/oligopeptide/nickel transport system permease subunit